ncbi:Glutamine--tRNA ligase [Trichinella spiralis]|uniref:Glutamine--tRNA ligase n=1 Tax=Trichinella spiralis TaxID=6334 RepID=A0ABR3KHT6_TRISP
MQLIISNWWMLLWTFYPEHQLCQCLCPSIDQLTRSVPFECNNIIGPSRSKCERHPMINNGKKNSLFLQLQHLLGFAWLTSLIIVCLFAKLCTLTWQSARWKSILNTLQLDPPDGCSLKECNNY